MNEVFVVGNLLRAIAIVLRIFIYTEMVAIIISALLSWVSPFVYNPIRYFFASLADIIERPLRRFIPPLGPIDITPFIAILILIFLDSFLVQTLFDLAVRLR